MIESVNIGGRAIDRVMTVEDAARKKRLVDEVAAIDKERPAPIPLAEIVTDGDYRFAGLQAVPALPLVAGSSTIPFSSSLCSRVHLGLAPAVVPEMRDEPALWDNWLELKQGLGVDWDIRAFCTTEVRLPDGSLYGTLCLHHREPRAFSDDEQALLAVLARIAGDEIARERARAELDAKRNERKERKAQAEAAAKSQRGQPALRMLVKNEIARWTPIIEAANVRAE